jgi:phthalate 4,5-cis-dihydrodiol dehydrogenase
MSERRLRVGVAGLGRAFMLMLPTLETDPRIELVAAADPRNEATRRFREQFAAPAYDSVAALCADGDVEVVYVATPHEHHAAHVRLAAAQGKHVLVEKPMAISIDECQTMIDACVAAKVMMVVGHTHSFDRPIVRAREMIAGGSFGAPRMISAQYYTDFLYRPRRPEELDTASGGGVLFSQAAHQVDIVRMLGGGEVRSVRAHAGNWDAERATEGAYAAVLGFAGGCFASLVYSGYAHLDGNVFCEDISELGWTNSAHRHGGARRALQVARGDRGRNEADLKRARSYGGDAHPQPQPPESQREHARWHEHFGQLIVSCERADLRPLPTGVMVYGDDEAYLEPLDRPTVPRVAVIDELYDAVVLGRPPLHDGAWSMATLEVCLAMLQSSREQREIALRHQGVCGHRAT